VYGSVRTVVWQGSVGDRRPYADQSVRTARLELCGILAILGFFFPARLKRMLQGRSSVLEASSDPGPVSAYRYFVYGITLHSEIPLALPEQGHGDLGRIELRVLFVVGVARAALCVLSTEAARKVAAKAATGATGSLEQMVWAVRVVSRYLPGATCLTQALAAQALLTQSGFPSQVEIGVAKDGFRRLQAHAWVVCHGQGVLGGQQPSHYNSITVLD
jgi:Transglutaminase-like superfamily